MIQATSLLEELGYELTPQVNDLSVYQVTRGHDTFYLIDSQYEFDFLNEEANVFLLASDHPVLVHVPLHVSYEEYLESFRRFSDWPVYFFVQGRDDGYDLTRQSLLTRLRVMGLED